MSLLASLTTTVWLQQTFTHQISKQVSHRGRGRGRDMRERERGGVLEREREAENKESMELG
jgi:hypothetical protein